MPTDQKCNKGDCPSGASIEPAPLSGNSYPSSTSGVLPAARDKDSAPGPALPRSRSLAEPPDIDPSSSCKPRARSDCRPTRSLAAPHGTLSQLLSTLPSGTAPYPAD